VQTNKQNSSFVIASGQQAALSSFFTKFLLNCDQWDGYNSERKALMQHLLTNKISNVVSVTGDIHGFFAGTVNDDFDAAGGGTPAMVDLVSAGISSDSFFTYMKDGAGSTGLATIIFYPLSIPVPNIGTITINVNMLDYTMGKAAPTVDGLLEQIRVQLTGALTAKGVPEGATLTGTVQAILAGLKTNSDFNTSLLGLAQQLAALGNNQWMKYINSDAQGYTVVTLTPGKLVAQFKQVNKLVNNGTMTAPTDVIARITTATVNSGTSAVSIS
jgi:alkaline phosphatase D